MAVRRERVVLELEDRGFSTGMAKDAAETWGLAAALDAVDTKAQSSTDSVKDSTTATRRHAAASNQMSQQLAKVNKELTSTDVRFRGLNSDQAGIRYFTKNSDDATRSIDRLSGRLSILAQFAAVLGPGLVPIAAATVPAIAGLAAEMGFAAAGAGVAILAFKGLGNGLKALNQYQLDPSKENLAKLNEEMKKLGPSGAEFVRFLDGVAPKLSALKFAARDGLFPGLEKGINSLTHLLPEVGLIVERISTAMGDLAAEAGGALSGPKFHQFFNYLDTEARPILLDTARTMGNFVDGFAALLVAFGPLSHGFADGLLAMSRSFADWAHGLQGSDSFAAFVDYVRTSGPQVLDLLGALAQALAGIAEAAAPVGAVVLPILTTLAEVIATIAKSDLGTPIMAGVAAMALLSRVTATYEAVAKRTWGAEMIGSIKGAAGAIFEVTGAQERATLSASALARGETRRSAAMRSGFATLGKGAALMGGLALASTGAADGLGLSNTATLALMGTIAGPMGAAVGGGIGLLLDMKHANDDVSASFKALKVAMDDANPTYSGLSTYRTQIDESKKALDDFNARLANVNDGHLTQLTHMGDTLSATKNSIEGWFGKSDVEEYQQALDQAKAKEAALSAQHTLTGASSAQLAQAIDQAAQAGYQEAASIQTTIDAMRAKRAEAARGLNAELNYKASLLDARDALKENGKTVNENTRAGQANLRTLYALPAAWNDQSNAAKNAKGALHAARQQFVDTAVSMGMSADKAKALAKRLYEIPAKVIARVEAQTTDAERHVRALRRELDSLHDKSIYVGIRGPGVGGMGPQLRASGGEIYGPGGPREDKVHVMASPGEWVIQERAVRKYGRKMIADINAMRLRDGGEITRAAARNAAAYRGSATHQTAAAASLDGLHITGVLDTPWGPAHVEGIARGAARDEISANHRFQRVSRGE